MNPRLPACALPVLATVVLLAVSMPASALTHEVLQTAQRAMPARQAEDLVSAEQACTSHADARCADDGSAFAASRASIVQPLVDWAKRASSSDVAGEIAADATAIAAQAQSLASTVADNVIAFVAATLGV